MNYSIRCGNTKRINIAISSGTTYTFSMWFNALNINENINILTGVLALSQYSESTQAYMPNILAAGTSVVHALWDTSGFYHLFINATGIYLSGEKISSTVPSLANFEIFYASTVQTEGYIYQAALAKGVSLPITDFTSYSSAYESIQPATTASVLAKVNAASGGFLLSGNLTGTAVTDISNFSNAVTHTNIVNTPGTENDIIDHLPLSRYGLLSNGAKDRLANTSYGASFPGYFMSAPRKGGFSYTAFKGTNSSGIVDSFTGCSSNLPIPPIKLFFETTFVKNTSVLSFAVGIKNDFNSFIGIRYDDSDSPLAGIYFNKASGMDTFFVPRQVFGSYQTYNASFRDFVISEELHQIKQKFNAPIVVGVALDLAAGKMWISINGVYFGAASDLGSDPELGTNPSIEFSYSDRNNFTVFIDNVDPLNTFEYNPGYRPHTFSKPSGFFSYKTDNFPDIVNPKTQLNTISKSHTETGAITLNTQFQPDIVWFAHAATTASAPSSFGFRHKGNSAYCANSLSGTRETANAFTWNANSVVANAGGVNINSCRHILAAATLSGAVSGTKGTKSYTIQKNVSLGISVVYYTGDGSLTTSICGEQGKRPVAAHVFCLNVSQRSYIFHPWQLRFKEFERHGVNLNELPTDMKTDFLAQFSSDYSTNQYTPATDGSFFLYDDYLVFSTATAGEVNISGREYVAIFYYESEISGLLTHHKGVTNGLPAFTSNKNPLQFGFLSKWDYHGANRAQFSIFSNHCRDNESGANAKATTTHLIPMTHVNSDWYTLRMTHFGVSKIHCRGLFWGNGSTDNSLFVINKDHNTLNMTSIVWGVYDMSTKHSIARLRRY